MMRTFSLYETAAAIEGHYQGEDRRFQRVSTDTRSLQPGDLFVALRGPNFDGHQFLAQALTNGAIGAVVDTVTELKMPQIQVADTTRALGLLGRANRRLSKAHLVAVTGSSGKTTVKEMLKSILSQQGETLATQGNLNNAIGVPKTLFGLAPEHRFGVIELGASGVGEIAWIVSLAEPEVVLITNAGQAHLEGFGSYDNIVTGKGEIIEGVADGGTVVLNADDPAFTRWQQRSGRRHVMSVSLDPQAGSDYWITNHASDAHGQRFQLHGPDMQPINIQLPLMGRHNVLNALLAAAAARALGADNTHIAAGLASVAPVAGRLQQLELAEGLTVLDDSYNANPGSMHAALEVLATRQGGKVAVLGDMAELGPNAPEMHRRVGEQARALGIDALWAKGRYAQDYCQGFGDGALAFDTWASVDALLELARPQSILVKGSRSAAMDQVVARLREKVTG